MPRPVSKHPTELELQILKILWARGALSVRGVRESLAEKEGRELAHTSVITVLNTMVAKNYLRRKARANAYIFEAAVARESVSHGIVTDVVQRVFDGSAASLMLTLLENETVSETEQEEIRKLIEQKRASEKRNDSA